MAQGTRTHKTLHVGWGWYRLEQNGTAHLCPGGRGRLSRTACNRLPVPPAVVLHPAGEPRFGIAPSPIWCCKACLRADGVGA